MMISRCNAWNTLLVGVAFCLLQPACSSDESEDASDGGTGAIDASQESCRTPRDQDAARTLVVARPYGDEGVKSSQWEVLTLAPDGSISTTSQFFAMGRAASGVVAFTSDGEIGLVAQEDGSVGVFRVGPDGAVEVLHAALAGSFYASEVVMSPTGDRAFIVDSNWRNNGGGIYSIKIGCDDSIKVEGLLMPAKLPRNPLFRPNGDLLLAAHDWDDSAQDQDLHLVSADLTTIGASITVFPDRDAIVTSSALTHDGNFVLVGDGSGFSGVPNRVAVASVSDEGLTALQVLTPVDDPVAMATSPFDDAAIVVSGFSNAVLVLDYDSDTSAAPFSVRGELSYQGNAPQLPGSLVMIDRGDLMGTVLIAENGGIRRVAFEGSGVVSDKGLTTFGSSYQAIVGAVGVQP